MGPQATRQLQVKEKVPGRWRLTGAARRLQTYRHSHRHSLHHIRNLHAIFSHGSTGVITKCPLTRKSPTCNILRRFTGVITISPLTRPSPDPQHTARPCTPPSSPPWLDGTSLGRPAAPSRTRPRDLPRLGVQARYEFKMIFYHMNRFK